MTYRVRLGLRMYYAPQIQKRKQIKRNKEIGNS